MVTFAHFENPRFPKISNPGAETPVVPVTQSPPKRRDETQIFFSQSPFSLNRSSKSRISLSSKIPSTHKFGVRHSENSNSLRFQSPNNKGPSRAETPTIAVCQGPPKQRHGTPKIPVPQSLYIGTSLMTKDFALGPNGRTMPMVLRRSEGGGVSHERGTPAKEETKGCAPRSLPPE